MGVFGLQVLVRKMGRLTMNYASFLLIIWFTYLKKLRKIFTCLSFEKFSTPLNGVYDRLFQSFDAKVFVDGALESSVSTVTHE
jgi:hypothetical protein